jgi:hypothetical protein
MLPTTLHALRRPQRLALLAGLAAMLALTSATGARLYQLEQAAHNRTVEIATSYKTFDSLATLTRQSDLVLVGRVVAQSPTRLVAQPKPVPQPFTPASTTNLPPSKAARSQAELAAAAIPPTLANDAPPPPQTQPQTDYTIEVGRVLKGTLATGARITVSQSGGTLELPTFPGGPTLSRTFVTEHDQLMAAGEQHLLFLGRTPAGGYYIVGGAQGRFALEPGGRLRPIDPATAIARQHTGATLESLAAEIDRATPR